MKQAYKSLVIKLGSEIFRANGGVYTKVFSTVASQVAILCHEGVLVTIVSSFAIRLGEIWLKENGFEASGILPPVLAGIGQSKLMAYWDSAFLTERIASAQMLISDSSLMHRVEWENARSFVGQCHAHSIVPILNANDPISWSEAQRYKAQTSDNDFVTAQLVPHIDATDVLFVTKVAGVFDRRPNHPDARRYTEISFTSPPEVDGYEKGDSNGGMEPKVKYAIECYEAGKRRVAISGPEMILPFGRSQKVSTMIGTQNVLC